MIHVDKNRSQSHGAHGTRCAITALFRGFGSLAFPCLYTSITRIYIYISTSWKIAPIPSDMGQPCECRHDVTKPYNNNDNNSNNEQLAIVFHPTKSQSEYCICCVYQIAATPNQTGSAACSMNTCFNKRATTSHQIQPFNRIHTKYVSSRSYCMCF